MVKESNDEKLVPFSQEEYYDAISSRLIAPLWEDAGVCSALCDFYLYINYKVARGEIKSAKEYTDFVSYINKKLENDPEKLEKFVKFINIIQSLNNSSRDIADNVTTITTIEYSEQDTESSYKILEYMLNDRGLLKLSLKDHDIVVFKRDGKYGFFDPNVGEMSGLSHQAFRDYLTKMIGACELEERDSGKVLVIHDGQSRMEAMLDNKKMKKALTELFDVENSQQKRKSYIDYVDTEKSEEVNEVVKSHRRALKVRAENLTGTGAAEERHKKYYNFKDEFPKLIEDIKKGKLKELDVTDYSKRSTTAVLEAASEGVIINKLTISTELLTSDNIEKLIKILLDNKDIAIKLNDHEYTGQEALFIMNTTQIRARKFTDKGAKASIKNLAKSIEQSVYEVKSELSLGSEFKLSNSNKLSFLNSYFQFGTGNQILELVMDSPQELSKEERKHEKPMQAVLEEVIKEKNILINEIIKERNVTSLKFDKHCVCNKALADEISDNKTIKKMALYDIQEVTKESLDNLSVAFKANQSIAAVNVSSNKSSAIFMALFDIIKDKQNITCLDISLSTLDDRAVDKLVEIINANNIEDFTISNVTISVQAKEKLTEALIQNTSIKKLNIYDTSIDNTGIAKLLQKNQYEKMHCGGENNFTNDQGCQVFEAIANNKTLKNFSFATRCELDSKAEKDLVNAIKQNFSIISAEIIGVDGSTESRIEDIINLSCI